MAPGPGDPALDQRLQQEGQALAARMLDAAGDPVRMRDALTQCLNRTGRQFGGTTVVALQHLSAMIATLYPGASAPGHHYEGTPR